MKESGAVGPPCWGTKGGHSTKMNLLTLIASLIFTFGLVSFGALSYLWLRELKQETARSTMTHGVLVIFATFWFAVLLFNVGWAIYRPEQHSTVSLLVWATAFLWPPLIMQMACGEAGHPLRQKWYLRAALWAEWAAAAVLGSLPVLCALGQVPSHWLYWSVWGFGTMFIVAALYSVYLERAGRPARETEAERTTRFWNTWLWGLVVIVMGSLIVGRPRSLEVIFEIVGPSFPLLFLFVNTYFRERLTFFDVFVKRGSFVLLTLLLLAVFFQLTSFIWLEPAFEGGRAWLSALVFLPVALSLPWLYARLSNWLDRVWLGRRFGVLEAVKHFLAGLPEATSEAQLVAQAEQRLGEIFQAPVQIVLDRDKPAAGDDPTVDVPIRVEGEAVGFVRVGRRENRMPLFSRDVSLLVSLSDVFSYNLENVRLQQRKQDQEKEARELMIHAGRSELKALRAQINPHFLFNALNAIASLIPRQPDRAEETVEQLAEVFRYTLKESDKEWTRLEDEIDFVRAYLEVEKARFGERLDARIDLQPGLEGLQIPTMIVQTLVENAVKHGIMLSRGAGTIRVAARRRGGSIRLEVADNGPGFGLELKAGDLPPSSKGTGFGLRSVQERLRGYFGEAARLQLSRDEERGVTIVAVEIPASHASPSLKTGTHP